MIKLVGIDLDGTLLNPEKKVTSENAKAIEEMEKAGIIVTVFTGRSWISGRDYLENIGGDIPAVFQNGAYIITTKSHEVLKEVYLDANLALQLNDAAKKRGIFCVTTTNFSSFPDMIHEMNVPKKSRFMPYLERNFYRMKKIENLEDEINDKVAVVELIGNFYEIEKILADFKEEEMTIVVDTILEEEAFVEILGKGCGKEVAMDFLVKHFGLSLEETAFIGDGYNDAKVLQMVSHAIVMGNAPTQIKNIAEFVTSTNAEDGVARAVREFILKERDYVDQNCHPNGQ